MGNLLSFPLLCLTNYLAFRFAIRRADVPVRINGDDIVFRCKPEEYERWKEVIGSSGLVLSEGKTFVDRTFFSLNSCLFSSGSKRVKIVPFIRSTSFFRKKEKEAILGLKGRFLSFAPGFYGQARTSARVAWLVENQSVVFASRRSLTRGLGLPVKLGELFESCLWEREAWYLSFESEKALPSPYSEWMRRPAGFTYHRVNKVDKEMRSQQRAVAEAFVAAAWLPARYNEGEWEEQLVGCAPEFSTWLHRKSRGLRRRARLLGLSTQNAKRFFSPDRKLFDRANPKLNRQGVWLPDGFLESRFESQEGNCLVVPKAANPPSVDIDTSRFSSPYYEKGPREGDGTPVLDPGIEPEVEDIGNFSFCSPSGVVTNLEFSGFRCVVDGDLPLYSCRDVTVPRYQYPPLLRLHVPSSAGRSPLVAACISVVWRSSARESV
jgi:hypothetical protein